VERAQAADKDTDEDEHKRKTIKAGEQFASRKKGKHRGRPKGATVGGNPRYSGKKGLGSTNQPDNFRTKDQDLDESKNTMDFYELNKIMNDIEYQREMVEMNDSEYQYNVLLELGDTSGRAKNLKGIADGIDNQIEDLEHQVGANLPHFHKLKGYAEQLRLIADELLGWE
jgi:hypothetical protein